MIAPPPAPRVSGGRTLAAVVAAVVGAAVASRFVWFLGFDPFWSVATVLVVGTVAIALRRIELVDEAAWAPPAPETPRGPPLMVATLARALAATERLAQPTLVRRLRALLVADRDDHRARAMVERRLRALRPAPDLAPLTTDVIDRYLDTLEPPTAPPEAP
jgi:hypothetical protein